MLKVFLVEDEAVIREGLRDNIPWEQYGYTFVGEAADGEMALPLIRKAKPDVLITDIKMPFMDGLSLSKIVSAELPKTRIIIISGYDDFEYARQAIEVGVEQYLLKPITKMNLKKVLTDLKDKIEAAKDQGDYQTKFQLELHEYEQFSRRSFFERLFSGEMSVKDIYEEAARLNIELTAPSYRLMLLYLQETAKESDAALQEELSKCQHEMLHYFLRHPQYLLVRMNVNTYGIMIKGEADRIEGYVNAAVEKVGSICAPYAEQMRWYLAIGSSTERLSGLSQSFQEASHYLAYRFILPGQNILDEAGLSAYLQGTDEKNIESVDSKQMNPEIIRDFLTKGAAEEIAGFVESYLKGITEALESRMFRDYVVLNLRFTVVAYLESIGIKSEEYRQRIEDRLDINMSAESVGGYMSELLRVAISYRERENEDQGKKILRKAVEYIDENYEKESLSLNEVAGYVDVSANYLSAVFSQSMQNTFVEYVTKKRMEKAKKLLRSTEASSGDIALQVGYKDPHYFSFVFKKTVGMSPREYRGNKTIV